MKRTFILPVIFLALASCGKKDVNPAPQKQPELFFSETDLAVASSTFAKENVVSFGTQDEQWHRFLYVVQPQQNTVLQFHISQSHFSCSNSTPTLEYHWQRLGENSSILSDVTLSDGGDISAEADPKNEVHYAFIIHATGLAGCKASEFKFIVERGKTVEPSPSPSHTPAPKTDNKPVKNPGPFDIYPANSTLSIVAIPSKAEGCVTTHSFRWEDLAKRHFREGGIAKAGIEAGMNSEYFGILMGGFNFTLFLFRPHLEEDDSANRIEFLRKDLDKFDSALKQGSTLRFTTQAACAPQATLVDSIFAFDTFETGSTLTVADNKVDLQNAEIRIEDASANLQFDLPLNSLQKNSLLQFRLAVENQNFDVTDRIATLRADDVEKVHVSLTLNSKNEVARFTENFKKVQLWVHGQSTTVPSDSSASFDKLCKTQPAAFIDKRNPPEGDCSTWGMARNPGF